MKPGPRLYFGALLALIVATAGGFLSNGLFFLSRPYQINYGEGLVAWQAAHIADPARAFAPLDRYPFVVFQYPPLYHLTARAMAALTRTDLLAAGRAVSLTAALILCVAAGWTTFRAAPGRIGIARRLLAAALAGALPMAFYNFDWAWLARVDMLAVMLSFGGVALFAAWPRSTPVQMMTSVLLAAALFTKQTAFAAPVGCLLVAWIINRGIFVRMLIVMGVLAGAAFGGLEWRTHGQAFLHLIRYNQVAFSPLRAAQGILMNVRHVIGPFLLAAGASIPIVRAAGSLARHGRRKLLAANLATNTYRRSMFLFAVYSALAALTSMMFGKEGSDINYFLEWNAAMAPLAGILLLRVMLPFRGPLRLQPLTVAALVVPLLLLEPGFDRARDGWIREFHGPLPADREKAETYQRMLTTVRETSANPVFSEDMNLLYKAGKEIPADPAMIEYLAKAALWDERPFVDMVRHQRFSLIVAIVDEDESSMEPYSPAVAAAILSSYELASSLGDYRIYSPRRFD